MLNTSETKNCKSCGSQVPENARFCNKCGKSEFAESQKCPQCGYGIANKDKVKFCPKCGKRLNKGRSSHKTIIAPDGEVHRCNICLQDVADGFTVCPSCLNCFHFAHLANWIIEKNECPVCKTKLEMVSE